MNFLFNLWKWVLIDQNWHYHIILFVSQRKLFRMLTWNQCAVLIQDKTLSYLAQLDPIHIDYQFFLGPIFFLNELREILLLVVFCGRWGLFRDCFTRGWLRLHQVYRWVYPNCALATSRTVCHFLQIRLWLFVSIVRHVCDSWWAFLFWGDLFHLPFLLYF